MQLPFEMLLLAAATTAAPLTPRSASFAQLKGLTALSRDLSTTDNRAPDKYFHESIYHPHYDGRFADAVLPRKARLFHMRLLLRSYMAAMQRAGVRTWAMHGSLLGWWWSQAMFPWDSDLDFCVEETGMAELGTWWNMTVHAFTAADLGLDDASTTDPWVPDRRRRSSASGDAGQDAMQPMREPEGLKAGVWQAVMEEGKKYLLEVNPHYTDVSTSDTHNVIDARWIDTHTGLFIDVTTVHPVPSSASAKSEAKHQIFLAQGAAREERAGAARASEMYTKDTHLYTTASLFPLRESTFEGARVFVPYAYEQLLLEEYGPRALVETWFNGYRFDRGSREWVVAAEPAGSAGGEDAKGGLQTAETKPKWTLSKGEGGGTVEDNGDGTGEMYTPVPGRVGDVHTVPGSA